MVNKLKRVKIPKKNYVKSKKMRKKIKAGEN